MVNIGKFSPAALATRPPEMTHREGEVAIFRNVVANWNGKWLRFDTLETARQIIPACEHYKIYVDVNDFTKKLGVRGLREVNDIFKCKSTKELWMKLQLNAYDPKIKYEEIMALESKSRINPKGVVRVKRYKRKLAYRFVFDPNNPACMDVYGRMAPQACALVDILHKGLLDRKEPVYTEEELQGLLEMFKGDLHTKQDSWRIFQYYRGTLIAKGFLRFHRETK